MEELIQKYELIMKEIINEFDLDALEDNNFDPSDQIGKLIAKKSNEHQLSQEQAGDLYQLWIGKGLRTVTVGLNPVKTTSVRKKKSVFIPWNLFR